MELPSNLDQLNPQQLRDLTASLIRTVNQQAELPKFRQLKIDRSTHARDGDLEALALRAA